MKYQVLTLIATLALGACSGGAKNEKNYFSHNLKDNVESVVSVVYDAKMKNGELYYDDKDIDHAMCATYDKKGKIVQFSEYYNLPMIDKNVDSTTIYSYDKKQRIVKVSYYGHAGKPKGEVGYEYEGKHLTKIGKSKTLVYYDDRLIGIYKGSKGSTKYVYTQEDYDSFDYKELEQADKLVILMENERPVAFKTQYGDDYFEYEGGALVSHSIYFIDEEPYDEPCNMSISYDENNNVSSINTVGLDIDPCDILIRPDRTFFHIYGYTLYPSLEIKWVWEPKEYTKNYEFTYEYDEKGNWIKAICNGKTGRYFTLIDDYYYTNDYLVITREITYR